MTPMAGREDESRRSSRTFETSSASIRSGIRRLSQLSLSRNSGQRHVYPAQEANNDAVVSRESLTIRPVPVVEVDIPDTALGSLDDHFAGASPDRDRNRLGSNVPPSVASRRSSCSTVIDSRTNCNVSVNDDESPLLPARNSITDNSTDRDLIMNRSRPNSRASLHSAYDNYVNLNESDNLQVGVGYSAIANNDENGQRRTQEHFADMSLAEHQRQGSPEIDSCQAEERPNKTGGNKSYFIEARQDDRALLPSQRDKAETEKMPSQERSIFKCKGALHSESCEHLRSSRQLNTNSQDAQRNNHPPNSTVVQPAQGSKTRNISPLQDSSPTTNARETSPPQPLADKTNAGHETNERNNFHIQRKPTYDDWEDNSQDELQTYDNCVPESYY